MELFNKYKNITFQLMIEFLNNQISGQDFPYKNLKELEIALQDKFSVREDIAPSENELKELLFIEESDKLVAKIPNPVPIRPTLVELQWLQALQDDPAAASLLKPTVLAKLKQQFPVTSNQPAYYFWRKFMTDNYQEPFADENFTNNLRTILDALIQKKKIQYVNKLANGKKYAGIVAPFKLEYSPRNNRFRLIIWHPENKRLIKINVANLATVKLLEEKVTSEEFQSAKNFIKAKRADTTPLVLQIQEKNNAVERCFHLFSSYDIESHLESPGLYVLKVFYYDFDEAEIIDDLLSLGSAITVLEPLHIREKIITTIQEALAKY